MSILLISLFAIPFAIPVLHSDEGKPSESIISTEDEAKITNKKEHKADSLKVFIIKMILFFGVVIVLFSTVDPIKNKFKKREGN